MKLSEAWTHYKKDKIFEGYSPTTLKAYKLQSKLFIRHVDDIDVTDVTRNMIKEYLFKDIDRLKPSSISFRLKYFKSLYRWLIDEGIVNFNPTTKIKEPKQEQRIPKYMDDVTIETLRLHCGITIEHVLLEVLFTTGCRISEVKDMDIDDVDWPGNSIKIIGKGNKEREVYFTPRCSVWLKKYIESRQDVQPALFVTERRFKNNNGQPRRMSTDQLRWIVKRVAKRAGIKNVYPHRYRHSLATKLINNGADLHFIQTILGHSDVNTTRIYADLSRNKRKEMYDQFM
jgi:integrase/recombinase XerD